MIFLIAFAITGAFLMCFLVLMSEASNNLSLTELEHYSMVSAIAVTLYVSCAGLYLGFGGSSNPLILEPFRWIGSLTGLAYWAWFFTPAKLWRSTGWCGYRFCAVVVGILAGASGGAISINHWAG